MIAESEVDVIQVLQLGFGSCKLALQAPSSSHIKEPKVRKKKPKKKKKPTN